MPLRSCCHKHLHEVNECEEEAERQHAEKQQFLVSAHLTNVAQDGLKRVCVILLAERLLRFLEMLNCLVHSLSFMSFYIEIR